MAEVYTDGHLLAREWLSQELLKIMEPTLWEAHMVNIVSLMLISVFSLIQPQRLNKVHQVLLTHLLQLDCLKSLSNMEQKL